MHKNKTGARCIPAFDFSRLLKYTYFMKFFRKSFKPAALLILFCLCVQGLSAQTPATAEEEYAVLFFTKLNQTQKRLDLMNREGTLEKLGTEEIKGLKSGTLTYKTSIKGISGIVTLTYDNYSDESGWVFNGEIIVKSNMAQNGSFDGKITVTGINPGTIYYDKVQMKAGKPASGTYGVELPGKKRTEVDFSLYFKAE